MNGSERLARLRTICLVAAVVGGIGCVLGALYWPATFYAGYLTAWLYWWSISCGALAISMIHHLSGGAWGLAIRPVLRAAQLLMPPLAILFVPVLFGLPSLYLWARPEVVAEDALLQHKRPYLNETAFFARAAAYFVIWSVLAIVLQSLAGSRSARVPRWLALVSGPGLVLWGLAVTFASIDWAMSLEPHWVSSSYGVLIAAGQGVAAMAFGIAVLVWLRDWPPLALGTTPDLLNDLGNFLLAMVMFWTYIAFTQFLIIWSGNLPEEATWYLHRSKGGWEIVAVILAVFHFAVPFLLLLARSMKRQAGRLLTVALLVLVMRLVDWNWLVMPALYPERVSVPLVHAAAFVGIGGVWLAAFGWLLPRTLRETATEEIRA
jgi:hypothetical protein